MPSTSTTASGKALPLWSDERKSAMTASRSHNKSLRQLAESRLSFEPKESLPEYFWEGVNETMTLLVELNCPGYSHLFPSENPRFGLPRDTYKADRQDFFNASKHNLENAAHQLKHMDDTLASGQGSTAKGDTTVGE